MFKAFAHAFALLLILAIAAIALTPPASAFCRAWEKNQSQASNDADLGSDGEGCDELEVDLDDVLLSGAELPWPHHGSHQVVARPAALESLHSPRNQHPPPIS